MVTGSQSGVLSLYSWGFWNDCSDRFPGGVFMLLVSRTPSYDLPKHVVMPGLAVMLTPAVMVAPQPCTELRMWRAVCLLGLIIPCAVSLQVCWQ